MHRTGQPLLTHRIAYGGDYNPEQWSPDIWREDIELMTHAGVNLVTLGVFSWACLEPRPGEYDFAWLDEVMNLLHAAGICVDLATPTASPPPWMGRLHPDTLARNADGTTMHWGSRNHFSPASQTYRDHSERIVTRLVERYAGHPAVVMWHVGNEYGQMCYSDESAERFRAWLVKRYGTLEAINEAWGTAFWSQRYSTIDEIIPPRTAPYLINPGLNLDFRRYSSDLMLECFLEQRDIIRQADPQAVVTTNFMGFFAPVNYQHWAPHLDVIADDIYPDPSDPDSWHTTAMTHTLMRSLARGKPWMIMEQAITAVNWRAHNVPKPLHQTRRETLSAIARGARGVCFFQWRASTAGSERFHSAMVPHQGPTSATHQAIRALGSELDTLSTVLENAAPLATPQRVALVFDWESWWATQEPALPTNRLDARDILADWHTALLRLGVTSDIVAPTDPLGEYAAVVVPNLYQASPQALANLRDCVERSDHLVPLIVGPFTAVADHHGHIHRGGFPVPLADLTGTHGNDWVPLEAGVNIDMAGAQYAVADFAEHITVTSDLTTTIAHFTDDAPHDLAGHPAITHNAGTNTWYCAARLSPDALTHLLRAALPSSTRLPAEPPHGVDVVSAPTHLAVINHTNEHQRIALADITTDQQNLFCAMTGAPVEDSLTLPPYDATILVAAPAVSETKELNA
ncbi:beta-galactosidase [Jonesia quinghaiensis]|uniref:beta-galactosidase n=1 Tax=Jonesia quinghaiensis TaxID=262806 RepID=UPI000405A955|nr:beta-galactosidase [Jonesia quinghaiensis]